MPSAFIRHLPNCLSMSRIPFLFLTTIMLFTDYQYRHTCALAFLILGSITDYLDGQAARYFKVVSKFGILFDSLADKILTVGVFITFLTKKIYPAWFVFPVLVILSRELLMCGLRMLAAKEQIVLAAEKSGKVKTAVQMVASCFSVGAISFRELGVAEKYCSVLLDVGNKAFLVSAVLAMTSGYSYFSKYKYLFQDEEDKVVQKK
ncbi:CDP-diacylglycerol-glycerol-3-phosphate_3-phosphatidyltransferase [Hexamita inflata]|uniref:CDP-diacylglycerol-glycerol-3-phosphate 3-phosphatidyltransferase n=1 Tax=Hexamita inflata TaxID=28002 RepID=A0AA86UH27_9EUKA|nr:CDP-diacylglycerol-glycerol-3-phosphate 3-phosphatidyltransferase [Hexamita inflata]